MSLLIAPATQNQLEAFLASPAHAVRLTGPPGIGKASLALELAAKLLDLPLSKLESAAYFKRISTPDKTIGIEEARELTTFLSLKVPGSSQINRVVLLEDGQLLTKEAQNALLKTLEEPPEGTVLILTASDDQSLLPTIKSRSQQIVVHRPVKSDTEAYFKAQGHDAPVITKAYAMSGGLPGLMWSILNDEQHPLVTAADMARQLLGRNTFERLALVDELIKNKTLLEQTIGMLGTMAEIGLQSGSQASANRWHGILEQSYLATERLKGSAQPKLVVDELILRI